MDPRLLAAACVAAGLTLAAVGAALTGRPPGWLAGRTGDKARGFPAGCAVLGLVLLGLGAGWLVGLTVSDRLGDPLGTDGRPVSDTATAAIGTGLVVFVFGAVCVAGAADVLARRRQRQAVLDTATPESTDGPPALPAGSDRSDDWPPEVEPGYIYTDREGGWYLAIGVGNGHPQLVELPTFTLAAQPGGRPPRTLHRSGAAELTVVTDQEVAIVTDENPDDPAGTPETAATTGTTWDAAPGTAQKDRQDPVHATNLYPDGTATPGWTDAQSSSPADSPGDGPPLSVHRDTARSQHLDSAVPTQRR
jgi:hypothetical protein